ncbi:MAG TPA: DUF3313 domain-containing protein [Candidatus Binataceae bacterium]|nr:DUF3313 domain-containing protein [Candidatus Binataceae bacterium]
MGRIRDCALGLMLLVSVPGLLTGCSQTVESKPAVVEQMQSGQAVSPAISGFFGSSLSLLQPGEKGQAAMVYVDHNADWSQYHKILLQPIQFWDNEDSSVSPADQQMLTAYFYNQLKQDLEKHFTIVDQGGPGVLSLEVALVNASSATPGLRSVSVIVPQARILNGVQSLATGSYAFVGSAEGEMKVVDSVSGQFLAGAIDKRSGGMALSSAAQWQWGDAENAMNFWSQQIADRLYRQTSGTAGATQSGSAPPS